MEGGKVADLQGDLFGEKKSVSLYKFEEIVRNELELFKIHDITADQSSMMQEHTKDASIKFYFFVEKPKY